MLTLDSAQEWIELIRAHPRTLGAGVVAPDWAAIGASCDAVTVTWRGMVATQGTQFDTPLGVTVPAYFSTASTWWTNWCFDSLTEIVPGSTVEAIARRRHR